MWWWSCLIIWDISVLSIDRCILCEVCGKLYGTTSSYNTYYYIPIDKTNKFKKKLNNIWYPYHNFYIKIGWKLHQNSGKIPMILKMNSCEKFGPSKIFYFYIIYSWGFIWMTFEENSLACFRKPYNKIQEHCVSLKTRKASIMKSFFAYSKPFSLLPKTLGFLSFPECFFFIDFKVWKKGLLLNRNCL